jgi:DNA invertase Pin-like site-specific DNA recombinase
VALRHGHEELDTSGGAALDKRPGLLAAVEAVERGEITAIYVAYFDRLARSTKVEDEVIERVEKADGDIFAVDLGQVTNGSATTKLTTKFMGAISEYIRNQAKERFDIAKQNAVAHGIWPSPKVPLGLIKVDKRLAHDPEYGPVVVRAYRMRDEGATIQDVREFLKVKGIKRDYSAATRMLCNPIYVGRFEYGSMVNENMVAPLIDEAVFRRVQKRRDTRGRRAKSERLLARLDVLRCKSCGSRMAVHTRTGTRSGDYPTYRCGKPMDCKDRPAISARIVEDFVERFTRLLASELVGEASNDPEVVQAERERETAQSAFDTAVEAFDGLDAQSVKKKLQELQEGVEATQHQLDQLTVNQSTLRQINTLRDWDDMTLNQKRGLIKAFYAEITVVPTREAKGIDRIRYKLRMHAELPESRRTKDAMLPEALAEAQRVLDRAA